jgi:hypothetical protein
MYVAIRQYGLLTNEPVEKVFQGITNYLKTPRTRV